MALKGIDVSEHQGVINWTKVAGDGVKFAVIRAGYGRNISQKDKCFENNFSGATKAGIPFGVYWYSYATTVENAKQEAEVCLKVLNSRKIKLPVFFDQEYEKSILALSSQKRTDIVSAFTDAVKKAGYSVGLYSSLDFYRNKLVPSRLTHLPVWMAAYTSNRTFSYDNLWGWQYSSSGHVSGISGKVDMNYGYFSINGQEQNKATNLLRKGDTGDKVKLLQHRLNLCGAQITEDGVWGVRTDTAVRSFQYNAGLVVDGIVGEKTNGALIQAAIIASGKSIGNYMVAHKWHYKDGTYKAAATFAATKEQKKPGSSCAHFVSWVLQDVGLLKPGKLISHKAGEVTGGENLIDCQIVKAGKLWNKLELQAGDICVWDSNIAIYAGDGKWFDAGGPFSQNCKNGQYIKLLVNPWYDRNKPIANIIRA